jgi:hypothetical protein
MDSRGPKRKSKAGGRGKVAGLCGVLRGVEGLGRAEAGYVWG